jgi:hypothetical protein
MTTSYLGQAGRPTFALKERAGWAADTRLRDLVVRLEGIPGIE